AFVVSLVDPSTSSFTVKRVAGADAEGAGVLLEIELGDIHAVAGQQAAVVLGSGHALAVSLQSTAQVLSGLPLQRQAQVDLQHRGGRAAGAGNALQLALRFGGGRLVLAPRFPVLAHA